MRYATQLQPRGSRGAMRYEAVTIFLLVFSIALLDAIAAGHWGGPCSGLRWARASFCWTGGATGDASRHVAVPVRFGLEPLAKHPDVHRRAQSHDPKPQ